MKHFTRKNGYKFLIGFGLILFFSIRLISLEADLPNWGIGQYQAPDEGPYGYLALNQLNYGTINPDFINNPDIDQYTAPHLRGNLLGNIMVYIGIKIFGDNYIGFRISSFFMMFINLLLIYGILNLMKDNYYKKDYKKGSIFKFAFLFLLIIDFMFTLASKVVETSIYRQFTILLCSYLYIKMNKSTKLRFFLIGFISVFSVCGIYITNLFFVVAVSVTVLIYWIKDIKKNFKSPFFYFLGGCLAFLVCELYYRIFWRTTLFENTLLTLNNFSGLEEYTATSSIYLILRRGFLFLASNFNVYNISMFFLFLLLLPLVLWKSLKNRDEFLILNLCTYGCLFLQTLYTEDYIFRKYILVVPCLIFLLYFAIQEVSLINWKDISLIKKIFILCYVLLCFSLCIFLLYYRFIRISDGSIADYSVIDIKILLYVNIIFLGILFVGIMSFLFINHFKVWYSSILWCFLSCVIINSYLDLSYIYGNRTYTDKKIMIELKEFEDQEYIVGDYILSYCLYNDIIPILNNYTSMFNAMIENDRYFLGYSTEWNMGFKSYIENELNNYGYELKVIKKFPREQKTFGVHRDVALYKAVKNKH